LGGGEQVRREQLLAGAGDPGHTSSSPSLVGRAP
jgi:hypothetical protein